MSGFVNLNRVRQQQARGQGNGSSSLAGPSGASSGFAVVSRPQEYSASENQLQNHQTPSISPPKSPSVVGPSSPRSPIGQDNSSGSGGVRRFHTVGHHPSRRTLHSAQVREEDEHELENDGYVYSSESLGGHLTRHGSLPSSRTPASLSLSPSGSYQPSLQRKFSGPVGHGRNSLASITADHQDGMDDWQDAIEEGRRSASGSSLALDDALDTASRSPLTRWPSDSRSSGNASPSVISSSSHDNIPIQPGHHRSYSNAGSADVSSSSSAFGSVPVIRRHQSLTQSVNDRVSDRLQRSPVPFGGLNSRYGRPSNDSVNGEDLHPPTSPIHRSPWDATPRDMLARDGGQWDSGESTSLHVPGTRYAGHRRSDSNNSSSTAISIDPNGPVTAAQLQDAFDAMQLGHNISTSSLNPPLGSSLRAPSPNLSAAGSPDPNGRERSRPSSRNHSRNSSVAPPRFASPAIPSEAAQNPATFGVSSSDESTPTNATPTFLPFHRPILSAGSSKGTGSPKLSLVTDVSTLGQPQARPAGPASASAYVPPIGHTSQKQTGNTYGAIGNGSTFSPTTTAPEQHPFTALGTGWGQKDAILGVRGGGGYSNSFGSVSSAAMSHGRSPMPQQQPMTSAPQPPFYSTAPVHGNQNIYQSNIIPGALPLHHGNGRSNGYGEATNQQNLVEPVLPMHALASPVDVPSLISQKGYNPASFDTNPAKARYFVIKSFTEDDVHKSLKYEIWSSTTFGNKRLDKAFQESASQMPIYLFFSVNASGHFCGVAQMLTEVDYNTTSTVWAQDKWKGIFRVKWIFVRDIPNQALRHIRLNNTPEKKPVTNSRDTQEIEMSAGNDMLQIFHSYHSKTSLLQDFSFYEQQALQKELQMQHQKVPQQHQSASSHTLQHPFATLQPSNPRYPQTSMHPHHLQQQFHAPPPIPNQGYHGY